MWKSESEDMVDSSQAFYTSIALIEETERIAQLPDDIAKIRNVYDAFLAEFPLCHDYWKKYADHEARVGELGKPLCIYERAVVELKYSVDIWMNYCLCFINTPDADISSIRGLFERALGHVGTHYLSSPLWDKYLEYESDCGRLAMIYTKILDNPIQRLGRYFDSFKKLAEELPLSDIKRAVAVAATSDASDSAPSKSDGKADEGKSETDPEELKKCIGIIEAKYIKAKQFESKIIGFEVAIGSPSFRVQPLSVAEWENWHYYLNFLESDGDFHKVFHLYERCVVACANYPEYWIRYVLCMKARGRMDIAKRVLDRATKVYVKRHPKIHLFAAEFNEQNEDIIGARASFKLLHSEISPGHLEAVMRHANMEQRKGNLDVACSVYDDVIAVERGKRDSTVLPLLYAQYSKFSYLVLNDPAKARTIVVEALGHVKPSKQLIHELLFLESILPHPGGIDQFKPLIEGFINPNADIHNSASSDEREDLSLIYIGFLHRFGDFASIMDAKMQHAELFLDPRISSELERYGADEVLASHRMKRWKTINDAQLQTSLQAQDGPAQKLQWHPAYLHPPQALTPTYGANIARPQTLQAAPAQPHQWNTTDYGHHQAYPPQTYPTHTSQPHGGYNPPQTPTIPCGAETHAPTGYIPPQGQTLAYNAYPAQAYPAPTNAPPAAPAAP